jgi:hypothetical protein
LVGELGRHRLCEPLAPVLGFGRDRFDLVTAPNPKPAPRKATKRGSARALETPETPETATAPGDAPILALAIWGDIVATADGDGRVRTWHFKGTQLVERGTLHGSVEEPITSLATTATGFVGAGTSLVAFSTACEELARTALPAVATSVVVRGDAVYVLAGKLLRFVLPDLQASGQWKHAKGITSELDVDDEGARALVLRDNKQVELIDLVKRKSLADWTRSSRKIKALSVRFSRAGKVLLVSDEDMRLSRVKDSTGRITSEEFTLEGFSNGPLVLDSARSVAAIGSEGEGVEVIDLEPARTRFFLDPRITDAGEKAIAGMNRIPNFKELAPGFFVRHGSVKAPPAPSTLSAVAVTDGGGVVAAGFLSGDVVVADTASGAVVSSQRGVLGEARCKARHPSSDVIAYARVERDVWLLHADGRFAIVDVERQVVREGPRLALEGDLGEGCKLAVASDTVTSLSAGRIHRWSRHDGTLLVARDLPRNKGAYLDGASVLLLPLDSLGHDGFDIVALDVESGESRVVVHVDRDAERFALGNDPKHWAAFGRRGTQPILTIWAGKGLTIAREFAFDLASGELGRELPWGAPATGAFVTAPDVSNPLEPSGAVRVTSVETGEEILRCPYEPGDLPVRGAATFDVDSKNVAAEVSDSLVAVWRPGARRLVLGGHRRVTKLWVSAKTLVVRDSSWVRVWDISGP